MQGSGEEAGKQMSCSQLVPCLVGISLQDSLLPLLLDEEADAVGPRSPLAGARLEDGVSSNEGRRHTGIWVALDSSTYKLLVANEMASRAGVLQHIGLLVVSQRDDDRSIEHPARALGFLDVNPGADLKEISRAGAATLVDLVERYIKLPLPLGSKLLHL